MTGGGASARGRPRHYPLCALVTRAASERGKVGASLQAGTLLLSVFSACGVTSGRCCGPQGQSRLAALIGTARKHNRRYSTLAGASRTDRCISGTNRWNMRSLWQFALTLRCVFCRPGHSTTTSSDLRRCSTYVLHWHLALNAERTSMSTTTVRLPDDLKKRLADVAEQAGVTSHALILQAISDRVEADEARNRLLDEADRRYAVIAETGQAVPWSEMRRYLERRVAGESTEPPTARSLSD